MSKGEDTRQFIIEKAAPIFNTKGIEATAMSDIMDATKLSKGSLYVHFKDKEALAGEVVKYNLEMLNKRVSAAMAEAKTAKEKLFAFMDTLLDVSKPPVMGGCPMINFGVEADDTNPAISRKIHEGFEGAQKIISEVIRLGIREGEFKPGWDDKEFAIIMFAMIEGAVIIGRVAHNNDKTKVVAKRLRQMITDQTQANNSL